MNTPPPIVGAWYQTASSELLEVVAYDPDDQTIEVQFYDGTVGEYDLESWEALRPKTAEPPEDWSGSLDLENEDYGVDRDRPAGDPNHSPLDGLEFDE